MGEAITFSEALTLLQNGKKIARTGWNGKAMWLELVPPDRYTVENMKNGLLPWIGMSTADSNFVPWLASQSDLLSSDWIEVK